MRFQEGLLVTALTLGGVNACAADQEPTAPLQDVSNMLAPAALYFDATPDTSFAAGSCVRNSRSIVVDISDPETFSRPFTVGMSSSTDAEGKPHFEAGVVSQSLGNGLLAIVTSTGEADVVNVGDGESASYLMQPEGREYAVSAVVHQGTDGRAYVNLSCLANFRYFGTDEQVVPLDEVPQTTPAPIPHPETPTPEQQPESEKPGIVV